MATQKPKKRFPVANIENRIEKLEETIEGNGSIGLKGRVVQLDTIVNLEIKAIREVVGDVKETQKWTNRYMVAQIVIALFFVLGVAINSAN